LLEASDGGFFFTAGAHRQEGEFPERVLLVKTSQHGDMLWQREFWGLFTKWIVSDIWATGDGGLIAVGTRESLGDRNAWVTKIGANGEQEWELLLGNESSSEQGLGVRPTQDGGFVVVGEKLYSNRSHLWLIKLAG